MGERWAGIVFDLDGTLVELPVDWEAVSESVAGRLAALEVEAGDGRVWDHLETARRAGVLERIEPIVSEHEIAGARRSQRLALADLLAALEGPIGVCSLNCERACRVALEVHGLAADVDTVVGRDTVATWKPDPGPLLAALEDMGVPRDRALFIGDSRRDAVTADRANVAFERAETARTRLGE